MKKIISAGLLGVVLPFVFTAIAFFLLPLNVAILISLSGKIHLSFKGVIFILPACIAVYSCINILSFILKRKSRSKLPQKFSPLSKKFYFILVVLDVWLGWILYVIYYLTCISTKIYLLFPFCSLLIIFLSCISILFPRNSQIGIRLPWSKYSKEVWVKTQKAGAIVTFVFGSFVVFSTLTNSNKIASAIIFVTLFTLDAFVCIYISYYYKQVQAGEKQNGKQN